MRQLYKWGIGATVSYLGMMYSWADGLADNLDWVNIIERIGVPTAFLIALLWMLYRGFKAGWPFIQEQVGRLVDVPREQLKIEREERQAQQKRYEETIFVAMRDQASALRALTEVIEKIVSQERSGHD